MLAVEPKEFSVGIGKFTGLEHRMEFVGEFNGVNVYNDSKATTPESMKVALESFSNKSVVLIAGGKDKGGDFEGITDSIAKSCKGLILIGSATEKLKTLWQGVVETVEADTLKEAVEIAKKTVVVGDALLLSPGCASFDMFKNFEDRGVQFKRLTMEVLNG